MASIPGTRRPWGGSNPTGVAGAGFGVEIVGLPEIEAILAQYRQPQLDAKLKLGMQAGGRVLAKSVRAAAPQRVRAGVRPGFRKGINHHPGDLYRSIRSRSLRGSPPAVAVGPMSPMRHLAIRTTEPHIISPLSGHFLAVFSGGRFAKVVHHPGNRAHPWVEAGVRSGRQAAIDAARAAIFRRYIRDVRVAVTASGIGGDD